MVGVRGIHPGEDEFRLAAGLITEHGLPVERDRVNVSVLTAGVDRGLKIGGTTRVEWGLV